MRWPVRKLSAVPAVMTMTHARKLSGCTSAKLPLTHRADIHVHELTARVVADTAHPQAECRIPQGERAYARDANVDGFRQHVL